MNDLNRTSEGNPTVSQGGGPLTALKERLKAHDLVKDVSFFGGGSPLEEGKNFFYVRVYFKDGSLNEFMQPGEDINFKSVEMEIAEFLNSKIKAMNEKEKVTPPIDPGEVPPPKPDVAVEPGTTTAADDDGETPPPPPPKNPPPTP